MLIIGRYKIACLSLGLLAFSNCVDTHDPFPVLSKPPQRVVLLLPKSEEIKQISEAIQEGFLETNAFFNHPLSVTIIYSEPNQRITRSYKEALKASPDLVVGPLYKRDVTQLARSENLPVPLLTLNYLGDQAKTPANFYQFGLSSVHELESLINHAIGQCLQEALILAPDDDWGRPLAQAAQLKWFEQSGRKARLMHYSAKMPITQQQLRSLSKAHTPSTVIFLIATSEAARQIKPFINLYFTNKTPVYAVSTIYNPRNPLYLNRDLLGIIMCDTPWSIGNDTQSQLKSRCIKRVGETRFFSCARYYGLGVDACLLALRLVEMDQDTRETIDGASGILLLDYNRVIQRQAPLAVFQNTTPSALASEMNISYNLTPADYLT